MHVRRIGWSEVDYLMVEFYSHFPDIYTVVMAPLVLSLGYATIIFIDHTMGS